MMMMMMMMMIITTIIIIIIIIIYCNNFSRKYWATIGLKCPDHSGILITDGPMQ